MLLSLNQWHIVLLNYHITFVQIRSLYCPLYKKVYYACILLAIRWPLLCGLLYVRTRTQFVKG